MLCDAADTASMTFFPPPLLVSWFAVVLWTGCGIVSRQGTSIIVSKVSTPHCSSRYTPPPNTGAFLTQQADHGDVRLSSAKKCTKLGGLWILPQKYSFYSSGLSYRVQFHISKNVCLVFCAFHSLLTTFQRPAPACSDIAGAVT